MQKFTPLEYIKIDIANSFGKDKLDWNDRISWFEDNKNQLNKLVDEADAPAQMYAGVMAYNDALKGIPSGYLVGMDQTCSGLQILSVLAGCKKSASTCNVVSTGHREDAYTNIYKAMLEKLGEDSRIERDDLKKAIMTLH